MEEQCLGITKSGNRCKIRVNLVNGYCRIHQDQAGNAGAQSRDAAPSGTATSQSRRPAQPAREPRHDSPPREEPRAHPSGGEPAGLAKLLIAAAALIAVLAIVTRGRK
jgi:hypothetical protein